ncbi:MAG: SDR family NAD(P)-dependent oxidoreductase [Myxococcota bacterium]|nr:short-chain dehydrogenase [Spirochaeta sp.]RPG06137.1 MAG: SDR family oxidoreductase [Proteobacteria bacterium TMED72]
MEEGIFQDRVALVTGAGSGIGRATAELLSRQGASIACADINPEGLDQTVSNIQNAGGSAISIECNVADSEAVDAMIQTCIDEFGKLNILANVAGVLAIEHTHLTDNAVWDRVLGINLNGTFYSSRAAIPHLLKSKESAIVNVASLAGLMGQAYCAAYCSSKAAVVNLTRVMAVEYLKRGLRVNCVCPGAVSTPLIQNFAPPENADLELIKRLSLGTKSAEPQEVAEAISYLASPSARSINGVALPLDHGVHAA